MSVLVIDVGTSGLRAAIVNHDSTLGQVCYEEFAPSTPAPGMVEFDATAMKQAVLGVARTALASASQIHAVGITNQRASTIAWRKSTGEPLGPAIGWQDLRTIFDCIMAKTNHSIALQPNQTATKAAWMLNNYITDEAERASEDICIGTVDSWVVSVLTRGTVHATDASNAAVTGLSDSGGQTWNSGVMKILGLHEHQFATIVSSSGFIGNATELDGAPPIMSMVGDQQASLVGQGCISSGKTKITFGTGGMLDVFIGSQPPVRAQRSTGGTFPIVAFSTSQEIFYGAEAIMLSAGTNIEWLRDDMQLVSSAAQTDEVAATCATTEGVVYVPALLGLGTPHWDYGARGTLLGITRGTTRAHVVRAVLEGVAHRGVDLVDAAQVDTGLDVTELRIDGGMSRNATFVQALADASGREVRVSPITEATTLGAGFLAGVAAGVWSSLEEPCNAIEPASIVAPLGNPGVSRQQWAEAISRARSWIPDLSALDF
ncbi:MAG: hypothetical protein EXQ63_04240 [Ilumatobacteraceae bacterium]|nr:hypothetical protein [Ilumatobacteraceae bacterium]